MTFDQYLTKAGCHDLPPVTKALMMKAWDAATTEQRPAPDVSGLTEALRQYQHNDGSGFVFAYDRILVDQHVAKLAEALQSLLDMQDQDCRYDHQGYCQNHNLDHIDVGCRVKKARNALAAYRNQGGDT